MSKYCVRVAVTGKEPVNRTFESLAKAKSFFGDNVKTGQRYRSTGYWSYIVVLLEQTERGARLIENFCKTWNTRTRIKPKVWENVWG